MRLMHRQTDRFMRGAVSVMFIVLLMGLMLTGLVALMQMSVTGTEGARGEQESLAALFLAESGVERAALRFNRGVNCGVLAENVNFGQGQYTIGAGMTTEYDGVTALPANRCRVMVKGVAGLAVRQLNVIVERGGGAGLVVEDTGKGKSVKNGTSCSLNRKTFNLDRLLVVGVAIRNAGLPPVNHAVTSVSYGGVPMLPLSAAVPTAVPVSNHDVRVELFYLVAPSLGNNKVVVTVSGGKTAIVCGGMSFSGVDQANPIDIGAMSSGTSSTPATSLTTSVAGAWLVDVIATRSATVPSPTAGQVLHWDAPAGNGPTSLRAASASLGPVAIPGTISLSWATANEPFALGALAIRPAGAGGGVVAWREVGQQ